jgi:hypothetical protein
VDIEWGGLNSATTSTRNASFSSTTNGFQAWLC